MLPKKQHCRINLVDLKALIVRKIGVQNAEKYFFHLKRLFSSKITKSEFNKLCVQTIGRENIHLHNQLIRSIVKNACLSKVPPQRPLKENSSLDVDMENGNALQPLFRKCKLLNPDNHEFCNKPSLLGKPQNGTVHENSIYKESPIELHSLGSRPPNEVASNEDGEEVEQLAVGSPCVQSRSPVTAPLGVSIKTGCGRKLLSNGSIHNFFLETSHSRGELPDTSSLRARLEHKLKMEGLSISIDCSNLINNGLDAYLKRLIEPCMGLISSRRGSEGLQEHKSVYGSISDFRASMELNPKILGADWAVQFEKICMRAWEG